MLVGISAKAAADGGNNGSGQEFVAFLREVHAVRTEKSVGAGRGDGAMKIIDSRAMLPRQVEGRFVVESHIRFITS